jgi:uncharacterized protein (TIGR00369 family)
MRLIPRHRNRQRKAPRIEISQAEITADLQYPGGARPGSPDPAGDAARRPVSSTDGLVVAPEGSALEVAEAFAEQSPESSRSRTLVWQDPVPTAAAGATMTGMEYMSAVVRGEVPPPPIAVTMRLRPVELEGGRVVFEGEPGEEHYNPIGVVHGGYAATLLDSALGCAVHTTLPAGVGYTSLGLEAKYVRPISRDTGRVLCEANVLYRGRKQATSEATLTAADSGKLLATGTATCMILGG